MTRPRVSTIALAPPERIKLDRFADKTHGANTYGYVMTDIGDPLDPATAGRVLTSGVGFTSPASRDDAAAIGRRRVLGQRPREAGPATSCLTVETRGLLRAMVNRTWGELL